MTRASPAHQTLASDAAAITQSRRRADDVCDVERDNLAARRAASEAIEIGRVVLDESVAQGEQLSRADDLADEQKYMLDRAARSLRGRTWGGWVANMFSDGPVRAGDQSVGGGGGTIGDGGGVVDGGVDFDYVDVPQMFEAAARAVADYRRHALLFLPACDGRDQRAACRAACDGLRDRARRELRELERAGANSGGQDEEGWVWYNILSRDKGKADEAMGGDDAGRSAGVGGGGGGDVGDSKNDAKGTIMRASDLLPKASTPTFGASDELARKAAMQDEHLDALSSDLGELQHIGRSLHETFNGQSELLDSIAEKSDCLEDQSKRIVRKADRLAERAKWRKTRAELKEVVTIRNLETGLLLGCSDDGSSAPKLQPYHKDATVWQLWTRQGDILGLKNQQSRKWLGQSMLGSVVCTATKFGRSEEWELDDGDRQSTRLLCAGANWGAGGWLELRKDRNDFGIGNYGVEAGTKATRWKVLVHEQE